ncbi:hypothetical protein EDL79_04150 [Ehrlichia ruminantium]|uniref:Uncharacterized protein n=1 Tax=Ehrlichia ruminantium TaxID=779 RepID=A0AAE6Q9C3_EHRRU|nr:hypothetical protein [Ehrlichia ruminantium]QGR02805.1 hypothetical protein EDL81_04130 [Ehrlichia ruminantium]QGR03729.1 hypothetical protein EDL80_04140 [Ehrlichia ruminantium]QGR04656.1 hypothetical protein EDL79_04150 [Ehrlichia ruminantium]
MFYDGNKIYRPIGEEVEYVEERSYITESHNSQYVQGTQEVGVNSSMEASNEKKVLKPEPKPEIDPNAPYGKFMGAAFLSGNPILKGIQIIMCCLLFVLLFPIVFVVEAIRMCCCCVVDDIEEDGVKD